MAILDCSDYQRAFNQNGSVIRIACDRWQCPACAKVLAWRWSRRVRYGLALWPTHTAYFWTLTLPGWVHTPRDGFNIIPKRWNNFRMAIARSGVDWQYAAFVECHPHRANIPHFHIVSLQKAPSRLKDLAHHAGFGYQAKEAVITSVMAANYVTKYATKQSDAMPKNFRRVRISQDWPRLPEPLYPYAVYPMARGERFSAYLSRISVLTGHTFEALRLIWSHREADLT